jgi:hypothetical protein
VQQFLPEATTSASHHSIYACRAIIPLTDNHLQQNWILFGRERVRPSVLPLWLSREASYHHSLLALATLCPAQESASTFKVDVKLVNVFVTVTDEHGAPVGGLAAHGSLLCVRHGAEVSFAKVLRGHWSRAICHRFLSLAETLLNDQVERRHREEGQEQG